MTEKLKSTLLIKYQYRDYIFSGRPVDRSNSEYEEIVAVADYVITHLELIITHQDDIESDNRKSWLSFVRMIYDKSPIIQILLFERRHLFSDRFWHDIAGGRPEVCAYLEEHQNVEEACG